MSRFKIPLKISSNNIYQDNYTENIEQSIKNFLSLIIASPNGSHKAIYDFGFSLKNSYFENNDTDNKISLKKISESSANTNSYAYDLLKAVTKFEHRLIDPKVEIDFDKEKQDVTISIKGYYKTKLGSKNFLNHQLSIHIW